MTGYGKSTYEKDGISFSVEVKTLNSKGLDLHLRLPKALTDYEFAVRNEIGHMMVRGKVMMTVDLELSGSRNTGVGINEALFRQYFFALKSLASQVGDDGKDVFRLALQMPDVMSNGSDNSWIEELWPVFLEQIKVALKACDKFRKDEGAGLEQVLRHHIERIGQALDEVILRDEYRLKEVRNRIQQAFEQWQYSDKIDESRFEQELIYYLDKLDIKEEKVRLRSHLDYFMGALDETESQGKKLNFISQEIGREINTIGSKSYDAVIQRLVVGMKDELEQIKEQLANIL